MSHLLSQLEGRERQAECAKHDAEMRAFTVRIKNGSSVRCSFPAMGPDSMTVAEQHECLCERGEYVSVKPAGVRS